MKNKVRQKLPKWFDGEIYEIGDEVRNPFSGETCLLNAEELSMYDLVKGAEMIIAMGAVSKIDECIDVIDRGKDWFLSRNPDAYMKLLD